MRVLALLLCLLASPAWATTYWMCPTGSGAGATDGTSQANCCDGVGDASCQSPSAGDTINLVGAFTAADRLVVPVAGSAGSPIKYQCQANTTIRGTREISQGYGFNNATGAYEAGHAWSLVAGTTDIYKQTGGFNIHFLREDGVLLTPTQHYSDSEATVIAALHRGEYTIINGNPKVLYYRPTNGLAPSTHSLLENDSGLSTNPGMIYISAKNYITIDSCDVGDTYTEATSPSNGAIVSTNSTGTIITGGSQTNSLCGITVDGGSAVITGVSAHDNYTSNLCSQGLAATTTSYEVKNSTLYNACNIPIYTGQFLQYTCDGDGIGVGHLGGTLTLADIHDNYIYNNGPIVAAVPSGTTGDLNRGSCITLSTSAAFTVTTFKAYRNYCYNNARYGIFVGGGSTPATQNVYITGNIIQKDRPVVTVGCSTTVQAAIRVADQTAGTGYRLVANNDLIDNSACSSMFLVNDTAGTTWDVYNNVFWSNAGTSDGLDSNAGEIRFNNAANTNFNEAYNKFGESGSVIVSSRLYRRGSTYYATVAAWAAAVSGAGVGSEILTANGFVGGNLPANNAQGFRLSSDSSLKRACKDLNIGNLQDNLNRAFSHPPSCGAMESTSRDEAAARTARQ